MARRLASQDLARQHFSPALRYCGHHQQVLPRPGTIYLTQEPELIAANDASGRQNRNCAVAQASIANENERLRQLLGWQKQKPLERQTRPRHPADPPIGGAPCRIDLGSRNGLSNSLPVLFRAS